jgi:hypothetical protein
VTVQEARRHRLLANQKRRLAEQSCAADFLRFGDERGVHAKRCVFGASDPCRREYDPFEDGGAPDPRMYEGTGIGMLYGFGGEMHAWQLAGWNIKRRRRTA